MSKDIRLSKAQLSKTTQLGAFPGNMMCNLSKKAIIDLAILLAKDVWPELASKVTSSILDKLEKKVKWERSSRNRNRIHFIHCKDIDDVTKIVKLLENAGCGFYIDQCYNWKRSHESRKTTRWISVIIDNNFTYESFGTRRQKSSKRI